MAMRKTALAGREVSIQLLERRRALPCAGWRPTMILIITDTDSDAYGDIGIGPEKPEEQPDE